MKGRQSEERSQVLIIIDQRAMNKSSVGCNFQLTSQWKVPTASQEAIFYFPVFWWFSCFWTFHLAKCKNFELQAGLRPFWSVCVPRTWHTFSCYLSFYNVHPCAVHMMKIKVVQNLGFKFGFLCKLDLHCCSLMNVLDESKSLQNLGFKLGFPSQVRFTLY